MSVLRNMMIADRIVSLGLLAAGLSHHIRNSLVAVKTFLDLAPAKMAEEKADLNGLRNPDFWKEYHQNVQSQIEKINEPAQGLVDGVRNNPVDAFRRRSLHCRRSSARRWKRSRSNSPRGGSRLKTRFPIRCPRCRWTSRNFTGCLNCCSRTNWPCCPPAAASP